mmetsp:Transcript_34461/g.109457  ORF Transcript_34461/g.109457 Transcript_34461/m.109457 type:complete len:175 (-) Transcript_34461:69-593(-)
MVPKADLPQTGKASQAEDSQVPDGEKERRYPQNPTVLRAAMEIVKRKKAEAIEKEQYQLAARFHQKLQELEAQLGAMDELGGAAEGHADGRGGALASGAPGRPRSLFATPNPFRTVELLRQSGYSRSQAYALLSLLYVAVFALEVLLVYIGWQFLGRTSEGGGDDVSEEAFDEF